MSELGLKVSIGLYALPLVGLGAFLKLLAQGRWAVLGLALAGFGLIFVGIDALQEGMQEVAGLLNLAQLPSIGLQGHVLAMCIGLAMTVIMQSSSAAVATTLTALYANAVSFEQAASLVIGAAVGTTVTGMLAAIGASVPAKRTALAHVLFNLATGLIAVLLLPLFLWAIRLMQVHFGLDPGATSLAAFHTFFIAAGVAVFLPMVDRFASGIERLLPDKGPKLARHLDDTLLHAPAVALEATRRALEQTACELFATIRSILAGRFARQAEASCQIEEALDRTQRFFVKIPPVSGEETLSKSRVALMHAIDHLFRLTSHHFPPPGVRQVLGAQGLQQAARQTRELLELGESGLQGREADGWEREVERKAQELAELRRQERPLVLSQTVGGEWEPSLALHFLDAMRWLDRLGYHAWRICHYLGDEDRSEAALNKVQGDPGQ
ncbi:MAG TPA: Na/Pi cotransporter family protein [Desulfonatronum sp.]|nr:Na/Pi cotransporter family protein [Desulfonatronum sp.]